MQREALHRISSLEKKKTKTQASVYRVLLLFIPETRNKEVNNITLNFKIILSDLQGSYTIKSKWLEDASLHRTRIKKFDRTY